MAGEEQAGSKLFHQATVYQLWITSPAQWPPGPRLVLELSALVSPAVAENGMLKYRQEDTHKTVQITQAGPTSEGQTVRDHQLSLTS